MKRTALRRVGLGRNWKVSLDKLCREVVFARDRHCVWCHGESGQHQWAHVRSRRYLSTRWDIWNSMRLCARCHLRWHHQPLEAATWFRKVFPDRAAHLSNFDAGITKGKVDRELTRVMLEGELKRYGGASD